MDTQIWATIIGAGGLGAVLLALVKGVVDWLSGAHAREKSRNVDALAQRDDAWAQRDHERHRADAEQNRADAEHRRRRQLAEYASTLRAMLLENGVPAAQLPPWPDHFVPTERNQR